MSPCCERRACSGSHVMLKPGVARLPRTNSRIAALPTSAGWPGASTMASSAQYDRIRSTSPLFAAFAHSRLTRIKSACAASKPEAIVVLLPPLLIVECGDLKTKDSRPWAELLGVPAAAGEDAGVIQPDRQPCRLLSELDELPALDFALLDIDDRTEPLDHVGD